MTAAPSAATTAGGGGRLVQPGETLSGIAVANGVSTAALAAANGLSPTSFVLAGSRLRIPASGAPTEATGSGAAGRLRPRAHGRLHGAGPATP